MAQEPVFQHQPWEGYENQFSGNHEPLKTSKAMWMAVISKELLTLACLRVQGRGMDKTFSSHRLFNFVVSFGVINERQTVTTDQQNQTVKQRDKMMLFAKWRRDSQHITSFCKGVLDLLGIRFHPWAPRSRKMDGWWADKHGGKCNRDSWHIAWITKRFSVRHTCRRNGWYTAWIATWFPVRCRVWTQMPTRQSSS